MFEKSVLKYFPEKHFRPRTLMSQLEMTFIFINGGMGDYLTWVTPIQWLQAECPWIKGRWLIPTYFRELAQYWMTNPEWQFHDYKELNSIPKINEMPFRGPVELPRESLNATGAHLFTCGWVYFTNRDKAPPGWNHYPHFAQDYLDAVRLPPEAEMLHAHKYAVITTGMTTNSRKTPPGAWNSIIEHVRNQGLTPVFLGRSVMETGNAMNIHTKFNDGTRFDLGLDLRDKTTLMQAASVMSRAAMVIGHDNGLLHLAGCTDVPIVFGYNIASPEHRKPLRDVGRVYNVFVPEDELSCTFCQSHNNFVIGFNFRECFFGDLKCMTMLFDNDGRRWKEQIDLCLQESTSRTTTK